MPIYDPWGRYTALAAAEEALRRWRDTMSGPAERALLEARNDPMHRAIRALGGDSALFLNERIKDFAAYPRIEDTISSLLKQRRDAIGEMSEAFRAQERMLQSMRPTHDMIASFHAASDVLAKMKQMNSAWALADDVTLSMRGFAQLSDFSTFLHTEVPFSRQVSNHLDSELGSGLEESAEEDDPAAQDATAVAAGMNPELIAFPPSAFSDVLIAAGFNFGFAVPLPIAVEAPDPTAAFDPRHGQVLLIVELALRHLVEKRLHALCGPSWLKRRVPNKLREQWHERQQADRDAGLPVHAPIHYAHLMELRDVIVRGDNWREAFQEVFRHPEHLSVSLQRLHPIRLLIAHPRPLPRSASLTLVAEAMQLLRAMGHKAE